jgi:hypothetical protein
MKWETCNGSPVPFMDPFFEMASTVEKPVDRKAGEKQRAGGEINALLYGFP